MVYIHSISLKKKKIMKRKAPIQRSLKDYTKVSKWDFQVDSLAPVPIEFKLKLSFKAEKVHNPFIQCDTMRFIIDEIDGIN